MSHELEKRGERHANGGTWGSEGATKVRIRYCTQCGWMLRATWMAQELLKTFEADLHSVSLEPATGGVFEVSLGGEVLYSRASEYPRGRRGYLVWRREAAQWHAARLSEIAREAGCDSDETPRLAQLVRKAGARTDPEAQLVEDVACLMFLRHYLGEFARRTDAGKLRSILTRTWRKMSPTARERALALTYSPEHRALLEAAHGESGI